MDLIEKLQILMKKNNIKNTAQLSKNSSIPYTTLKSIFDGNVNDVRLSTSKKLCNFFNITLDDLLDDDIELDVNVIFSNELSDKLKKIYGENSIYLLNDYNKLNNLGKQKANENIHDLTKISDYIDKKINAQNA